MKSRFQIDPWYRKVLSEIEGLLKLKIPIQYVYFPSSGFNSALEMLPEYFLKKGYIVKAVDIANKNGTSPWEADEMYKIIYDGVGEAIKKNRKLLCLFRDPNIKDNILDLKSLMCSLCELSRSKDYKLSLLVATKYESVGEFMPKETYIRFFNYYFQPELLKSFEISLKQINQRISKKEIELLASITGFMPSLARNILRDNMILQRRVMSDDFKLLDTKFFETHQILKTRLDNIFNSIPSTEIEFLRKCSLGKKFWSSEELMLKKYRKLGVLDENNSIRIKIISDILRDGRYAFGEQTVANHTASITKFIYLDYDSQELVSDIGQTLTILSPNEYKLVKVLLETRGRIVDRDRIAKTLWRENHANQYSDWAIDKAMSTLRKKFRMYEKKEIIKTVRSRGFLLR